MGSLKLEELAKNKSKLLAVVIWEVADKTEKSTYKCLIQSLAPQKQIN